MYFEIIQQILEIQEIFDEFELKVLFEKLKLNIYFDSIFLILAKPSLALALVLEGVYIVFRGVLFKNIMDSSLRKRKYVGVFK